MKRTPLNDDCWNYLSKHVFKHSNEFFKLDVNETLWVPKLRCKLLLSLQWDRASSISLFYSLGEAITLALSTNAVCKQI